MACFVLVVVWRLLGWGTWGNGATRGCLCWIKPRTSYLIAVCNLFGVVCVWGRGGVGDNFKKFIWGVMLLGVADFSSGECVIKGVGQITFSLVVYHLVSLCFFRMLFM